MNKAANAANNYIQKLATSLVTAPFAINSNIKNTTNDVVAEQEYVSPDIQQQRDAATIAEITKLRAQAANHAIAVTADDDVAATHIQQANSSAMTQHNVRVTGASATTSNNKNKKCPCLVGPYKEILPKCKLQCGPTAQAHHIVADKTFRIGTRNDKTARIPTIGDYKSLPTLKNGAAICLDGMASVKGTAHNIAHRADLWVKNLGNLSDIKGLASIRKIADLYMESAIFARPDCADLIIAEVNKSLDGTNPNAMGRTTTSPIKQGSPAHNALGIGK